MPQVLGPDRFRDLQACGSDAAPEKRKKVSFGQDVSEASVRRSCLADWMELSVNLAPSLRQARHRALPRGLQDRFSSSVRHYLTQVIFQTGKAEASKVPTGKARIALTLTVWQVHEGADGILVRAQVVQGCSGCPDLREGSLVRLLLHLKHPVLQALQLRAGINIQVADFSVIQACAGGGALLSLCGSISLGPMGVANGRQRMLSQASNTVFAQVVAQHERTC
ncbi:unnamed protein product [Durusdinium trenchii]|uniref:Uncharacterized protein n=1 Tax=Durusdinium trenchii TaxID=1381693 RepID=A0ABP0SKZ9_9DINO